MRSEVAWEREVQALYNGASIPTLTNSFGDGPECGLSLPWVITNDIKGNPNQKCET